MKEKYTSPEMEIIEFETQDIITTSLISDGDYDDFSGDGEIHIP